jgi:hypothetical protein
MRFLTAQVKGIGTGFFVLIVWATMDWLAARHGLPFGRDRNYWDAFFGAVAGASIAYTALPPSDQGTPTVDRGTEA